MQQQKAGGFRGFVQTPAGRALLIAIAIVAVFATFAYSGVLFAIPVFLVVGLALPIYVGVKRPRFLAILGVIVLLLVPPTATFVLTNELMTPVGAVASNPGLPEGHGGSVLQNAQVTPFTGSSSTNFTWNVTIYPQYLSSYNSSPLFLSLYISTCPGATGPNDPNCAASYPFDNITHNFSAGFWTGRTTPTVVTINYTIGSNGLWYWQMGLAMQNLSTRTLQWVFLQGDPTYDGIQGPVIGSYATIYSALVGTVYLDAGLFLGLPFFFILLIYVVFKNRQQRRADANRRRPEAVPPVSPPSDDASAPLRTESSPAGAAASPRPGPAVPTGDERKCPNCQAVVYANETTCWKCGTSLTPAKN